MICQQKKAFQVSIKMKLFYYQGDLIKLLFNRKKKINTNHLRLIPINRKIILN